MNFAADSITPVVLTRNEAPNLDRTLAALAWARRIVVLDSGSTDETEAVARAFPNVDWHVRPFDSHGGQWRHAIHETGIETHFALALDADMEVPRGFVEEIESSFLPGGYDAGIVPFEYRYHGRALRGSVYPSQLRLFRPRSVRVEQPGHSQAFAVEGRLYRFRHRVIHDDRKPIEAWIRAQVAYSALEADRLALETSGRLRDRLRRLGLMPPVVGVVAWIRAGGPFGGFAALRYACERAAFECLLAIRWIDRLLREEYEVGPSSDLRPKTPPESGEKP